MERPDYAGLYTDFCRVPSGYTIPTNAYGPVPAINGNGCCFRGGRGGGDLHPNVTSVRFMYPFDGHPNGYVMYGRESDRREPDGEGSRAAQISTDAFAFESEFVDALSHWLSEATAMLTHRATVAVGDHPSTMIELFFKLPNSEEEYLYRAPLWDVVSWYEAYDPEQLQLGFFVDEFAVMMFDDLERVGIPIHPDEPRDGRGRGWPRTIDKVIRQPGTS